MMRKRKLNNDQILKMYEYYLELNGTFLVERVLAKSIVNKLNEHYTDLKLESLSMATIRKYINEILPEKRFEIINKNNKL